MASIEAIRCIEKEEYKAAIRELLTIYHRQVLQRRHQWRSGLTRGGRMHRDGEPWLLVGVGGRLRAKHR